MKDNEKGMALIMVLIVMLILVVFIMSALTIASQENNVNKIVTGQQQAQQAADSGVEYAMEMIKNGTDPVTGEELTIDANTTATIESIIGPTLIPPTSYTQYKRKWEFVSVGKYGNAERKIKVVVVRVNSDPVNIVSYENI